MIHKNSFRISRKRFFISGLLVLAFLIFAPVTVGAVSDVQFKINIPINITFSKFNPYLSKLNDIKNEMVASVAQVANILDSLTDNLRNAWKAYVNPLPPLPTTVGTPTEVGPIVTVATPPPIITDQALLKALRILFAQKDYLGDLEEFRGQRGPEGTQGIPGTPGPQGPAGPAGSGGSSSVTYIPSNPSTNFGGASIFSVTDL